MSLHIVQPRDCELLLGIPLSAAEFLADLQRPEQEYAAIFRDLFLEEYEGTSDRFIAAEYEQQVARPILTMVAQLERWGARVERSATAPALKAAFRSRVVGLMAHTPPAAVRAAVLADPEEQKAWRCVELRDGPATISQVADAIPDAWDGIVDLIACESLAHAHALKRRHPEATFIVNKFHALPVERMERFYQAVEVIKRRPQTFGDAVVEVITRQDQSGVCPR